MTIDEKVRKRLAEETGKSLAELGCRDGGDVMKRLMNLETSIKLEAGRLQGDGASSEADRAQTIKEFRDWVLGRKNGLCTRINEHWFRPLSKEWKRNVNTFFEEFKKFAAGQVAWLESNLRVHIGAIAGREARHDLTLPGHRRLLGSIHPVTQVMREIEEVFLGLGFSIESGPEVESVYYNFDALNIPESHPARDDWDTIYVNSETVLRTHTSPVQIRAMEKHGAPLYILCPGKAYRHDNPDSTHATMFHQVEGLAVDTDISFADLKGTLDYFAKKFFGDKIKTNFSPSFFPFTEPSGELAISCVFCNGQGCRVCKESGWVEVMGCGMVHPEVLRHGGIDPERYSGWAFGLGVERFAMMKYDINDIQLFQQGDVRFLEQF